MSEANRTLKEYTQLYARTHGIDTDAAAEVAVVKAFGEELEHEKLRINKSAD